MVTAKTTRNLMKSFFTVIVALSIDAIFHTVYTTTPETTIYFMIKTVSIFSLSYWYFTKLQRNQFWIPALIHVLIFSIYYRFFELIKGLEFLYRSPDVILFGKTLTPETDPYSLLFTWLIIHGGAMAAMLYYLKKR